MKKFIFPVIFILFSSSVFAAVGCDLNDPDRDVKRLFPGSTGYKTSYVSLEKGGSKLQTEIEQRLGDKFKGLYETVSVPYTLYEIHKGKDVTGYIHGVNQKGVYGGIQVFLALDKEGVILSFYIQKLTSKQAAKFRSAGFGNKFKGLSLKEFYGYDVSTAKFVGAVPDAFKQGQFDDEDLKSIMRAVKKNLILMDEFVYNNKHIAFFKKGG